VHHLVRFLAMLGLRPDRSGVLTTRATTARIRSARTARSLSSSTTAVLPEFLRPAVGSSAKDDGEPGPLVAKSPASVPSKDWLPRRIGIGGV